MTTTQIEDFINDNILDKSINQAEEELKTMFSEVECYDEDIDDKLPNGDYLMYKGFNCSTDDEYFDITLYYVDNIVTDYRVR